MEGEVPRRCLDRAGYWVWFESDHSDEIAYTAGGAPGLLNRYSFSSNQASSWNEGGIAGVSVRIFGITGTVPQPAMSALMISGVGMVGGRTYTRPGDGEEGCAHSAGDLAERG
jgi:hypothetical protein